MRSHSGYYDYEERHRSAIVTAQTSHHKRPVFSKWLFGAYLSRLVPISHLIYAFLDLIALPPLPTTPHPIQASSAAPILSMAKLVMHRRVSTYSDDSLNPPYAIASAPHSRRHAFVSSVNRRRSFFLSLSRHRPIFAHRGRQDQASRRARQTRARHQHLAAQQQPQQRP